MWTNELPKEWKIEISGGSEVWVHHDREFVARFKYGSKKASANHFVKFLTKNFTPQEYFEQRAKGVAPLTILESKGYVSYNMIKAKKLQAKLEAEKTAKEAYWKMVEALIK